MTHTADGTARRILLTGVTRGIGRALVPLLVARGHLVAGCGRSTDAIAQLSEAHPDGHHFAAVDVADAQAVDAWAAALIDDAGFVPDLVLNNAAIMNDLAPLWKVPADEFARMLAVNIGGVAHIVRAFTPAMIRCGRGIIVNLSSGWGRSTSPDVGPYCTTKYAIEGFSGSLAQELPSGMACVCLSPGVIDTQMLRKCLPDTAAETDGPDAWAARNVDTLLALGPDDNGVSLSLS